MISIVDCLRKKWSSLPVLRAENVPFTVPRVLHNIQTNQKQNDLPVPRDAAGSGFEHSTKRSPAIPRGESLGVAAVSWRPEVSRLGLALQEEPTLDAILQPSVTTRAHSGKDAEAPDWNLRQTAM